MKELVFHLKAIAGKAKRKHEGHEGQVQTEKFEVLQNRLRKFRIELKIKTKPDQFTN